MKMKNIDKFIVVWAASILAIFAIFALGTNSGSVIGILRSPSDPSVGDAHIRYDGSCRIFIAGRIEHVDYGKFVDATKNIRGKATVFLDSPGGNLDAGLNIGRLIKEKRWSTSVVSGKCASSCGLIWLAG